MSIFTSRLQATIFPYLKNQKMKNRSFRRHLLKIIMKAKMPIILRYVMQVCGLRKFIKTKADRGFQSKKDLEKNSAEHSLYSRIPAEKSSGLIEKPYIYMDEINGLTLSKRLYVYGV